MASPMKEIGKSISGAFGATTAIIQGASEIATSVAGTTVKLVDGLGDTTGNLVEVSTNYSKELVLDSNHGLKKAVMVNDAKGKALEAVLADKNILNQLAQAEADSLVRDIFDDYDLPNVDVPTMKTRTQTTETAEETSPQQ